MCNFLHDVASGKIGSRQHLRIPAPLRKLAVHIGHRTISLFASLGFVVALTIAQYWRYGTRMFLGWDSSYYVYQAVLVDRSGLPAMIDQWKFPNLYVLLLWALGRLVGDYGLVERILPFAWLLLLLFAYGRITRELTHDPRLEALTVLFAGITVNTIRMFADLNRQLMALSLALIAFSIYARDTWSLRKPTKATALLLVLLFVIASTHVETYAVVMVALAVSSALTGSVRRMLETVSFVSIPLLTLAPLLVGFFSAYPAFLDYSAVALRLEPWESVAFIAGSVLTVPAAAMGGAHLVKLARLGDRLAEVMASWMFTLGAAFIVLVFGIVTLPPIRVLYLIPVPLLLTLGIPVADRLFERWFVPTGKQGKQWTG